MEADMAVSVFDLFSVGIGPSSSHTVGPMRAAQMFVKRLDREGLLPRVARVRAELFGSLGATGHGHGTPKAVLLGLEGHRPADVDVRGVEQDLVLHRRKSLPYHPNGLQFAAFDAQGAQVAAKTYYSVGGGFVLDDDAAGIIPAVLHYYTEFVHSADENSADEDGVVRFLLAAGAVGMLFKENASISGAEVGCQGEVGSACSMPRSRRSPPRGWRCAATAGTTSPWTRSSRP
jgi:L-serine deaminase